MIFGFGVISIDLGGLVAIVAGIVGAIVWLVRLEGSTKRNKEDNVKMNCKIASMEQSVNDLNIKMSETKKDVGFIKTEMTDIKEMQKKIIELLTK